MHQQVYAIGFVVHLNLIKIQLGHYVNESILINTTCENVVFFECQPITNTSYRIVTITNVDSMTEKSELFSYLASLLPTCDP